MQTHLKKFQRKLRQNMPFPERMLWKKIRRNQLGVKFRRQYVCGNRIFDFYSPEMKLAVEIDGESHFINDSVRECEIETDKNLELKGIRILRFLNTEITKNIENVLAKIFEEVKNLKIKNPHLSPLPQ